MNVRPALTRLALACALASSMQAIAAPSADSPLRRDLAAAKKGSPAIEEVGDPDSFGRNLTWLGVADATVELAADCSTVPAEFGCAPIAAPAAYTGFEFEDLGHIVLPARASHSMLCYWLSPVIQATYANPSPAPVVARLFYNPTLTVENPVLATPGLIDPTTGVPFAGRLRTGMTSVEIEDLPLPAGTTLTRRTRDSAVCIAGFLTQRSLMVQYGLSEAQAREFFRQPTTVRLNVSGGVRHVSEATLYFGLRIVGD